MDGRYFHLTRIAACGLVLSLSACQQNSNPTGQPTVAGKSGSNQVAPTQTQTGKQANQEQANQEQANLGRGPIIQLEPTMPEDGSINPPVDAIAAESPSVAPSAEPSAAPLDGSAPTTPTPADSPTEIATRPNVSAPNVSAPSDSDPNVSTPSLASSNNAAVSPSGNDTVSNDTVSNDAGNSTEAEPQKKPANTASADSESVKPRLGNVATDAELKQKIAEDWPVPQMVLYVSGQQQGYLEPCGCTGLDSQKGGMIRRDSVLTSLRARGWEVVPLDVGNQNREKRSSGPQPQIKFETTAKAMQLMGYKAAGLGVHDLELSRVELINTGASGEDLARPFISGNVIVYDRVDFFPAYRIVEAGGRKVGITSVIGKELEKKVKKDPNDDEVEFFDPIEKLKVIVPELKSKGCDFVVLLAHASLDESGALGKAVEGIDLVVTAGGYGEPTLLPEPIKDSKAVMVQVGTKGMYGGIVGLFDDPANPIRYQKIAISSQFKDSERMLKLFAEYQDRLKEVGFSGLGLTPALHPTGRSYVGSETCGECHTQAFEIWKDSPHVHATDSIVAANNDRGGIERHYDPECVSCHVTGWNPQGFSPYQSGYTDLQQSKHLLGSGCENCHGPGSAHVEAENGNASTDEQNELRQEMILPLAKAESKCMECHDFDNSPDFHAPGAFEKYWEQVKHYGKD